MKKNTFTNHGRIDLNTELDNALNNINERNPVRLKDYTPQVLVENGVKNLPMYENPSHIRMNILTKKEAQEKGLSIKPKDHYHGLGKDIFIKAINSLGNSRVIFKRNDSNDYVILTTIKDSNSDNIIVPIEVETTTNVNKVQIDINRIKSAYGYNRKNPNLNKYIKDNINSNSFVKIYEQKKNLSTNITPQSSSHKCSISNYDVDVKSDTLL